MIFLNSRGCDSVRGDSWPVMHSQGDVGRAPLCPPSPRVQTDMIDLRKLAVIN